MDKKFKLEVLKKEKKLEKVNDDEYIFSSINVEKRNLASALELYKNLLKQKEYTKSKILNVDEEMEKHKKDIESRYKRNVKLLKNFEREIDKEVKKSSESIKKQLIQSKTLAKNFNKIYENDKEKLFKEFEAQLVSENDINELDIQEIDKEIAYFEGTNIPSQYEKKLNSDKECD